MISTLATKKNSLKKKNINKRMGIIVFKTLKPKNVFLEYLGTNNYLILIWFKSPKPNSYLIMKTYKNPNLEVIDKIKYPSN